MEEIKYDSFDSEVLLGEDNNKLYISVKYLQPSTLW